VTVPQTLDHAAAGRSAPAPRGRLRSLDGLRGVASVVVLAHHSLLIVPSLAAPYYGEAVEGRVATLFVRTPLHLFWAGTEAVYLFFVLSGLVLTLASRSRAFTWSSYFPSRIVRLYLPVLAAILFAALMIAALPRGRGSPESMWMQRRPDHYSLTSMLIDGTLINGTTGAVSPLWSLKWEVLFSVLLPVFILGLRRVPASVQIPFYLALSLLGEVTGVSTLKYLPMFGVGVALAAIWDRIGSQTQRVQGAAAGFVWTAVVLVSLCLVMSYWALTAVLSYRRAEVVTLIPILLGVTGLVVAAGHAPVVRRLLSSRVFVFLGMISFSLYLVHEPIVVAIGSVVSRPAETVVFALPAGLLVAYAFYLVIERPSHLVSQRIRRAVQQSDSESQRASV